MTKNIFIELELRLDDQQFTKVDALENHLKGEIAIWNNDKGKNSRTDFLLAKALRSYVKNIGNAKKPLFQLIEEYRNSELLDNQRKTAYAEKYAELESRAKEIIALGVVEKNVKNLVSEFKQFFKPDTIIKLVPLESSSSNQSEDEFVIPKCPASLKCDKPIEYKVMVKISNDLDIATDGKCDTLYKLFKFLKFDDTEDITKIHATATEKWNENNKVAKKTDKVNAEGRLLGLVTSFFKSNDERKKYDVSIERFRFEKHADTKLKAIVEVWLEKKKTDWKQYFDCIDEVRDKLKYSQEEAAWLVYDYFCTTKKCIPPEKPKNDGWGKYEPLREQLLYVYDEAIKYHERSHQKIKTKLEKVKNRFQEDIHPDSVLSTLNEIHGDLRNFWDSCINDGIVTMPLFRPAILANYPDLQKSLQYFLRCN